MELFLLIALGVSFVFIIAQSIMLYRLAKMIEEDTPPF